MLTQQDLLVSTLMHLAETTVERDAARRQLTEALTKIQELETKREPDGNREP